MTRELLETLPRECLIAILQFVSESILVDLTNFERECWRGQPYSALLNQYRHLALVCHDFHIIITRYIRVDDVPIRQKLLALQAARFSKFLDTRGKPTPVLKDSGFLRTTIMRSCGAVWGNPTFFDLFPRLFDSGEYPGNKSLVWFKYLAPKKFDERLVKTIEANSSLGDTNSHTNFSSPPVIHLSRSFGWECRFCRSKAMVLRSRGMKESTGYGWGCAMARAGIFGGIRLWIIQRPEEEIGLMEWL